MFVESHLFVHTPVRGSFVNFFLSFCVFCVGVIEGMIICVHIFLSRWMKGWMCACLCEICGCIFAPRFGHPNGLWAALYQENVSGVCTHMHSSANINVNFTCALTARGMLDKMGCDVF